MPPSHHYRERDYEFANTFVALRTTIGLTQRGLAKHLGISSRAVENWEQGLTTPKAEHLKTFLALCIRASAFTAGREQEQIHAFWKAAHQKVTLNEDWLSELLTRSSPSTAEYVDEPSPGSEQASTIAPQEPTLWTVPYARNPHFTGRDHLLSQLEQQLAPGATGQSIAIQHAALTQAQAIKGLGGIGKTQTAIEYAYRSREQGRYKHILWISAASEETVLASFAALKDLIPALRQEEESDQHAFARKALRWLEQRTEPWLLIYDNADDLAFLPAYLPTAGQGSILLTTRASAVGALTPSLEVSSLPLEEGVQLLLRRAGLEEDMTEQEREEASMIVQELGLFPLAIDQAAAYLEETGCSLYDYIQIYQQHQYRVLERRGRQASGYPDSVATTWSLAFERIEKRNKAAAELLRLCAFVAPDHIPEELLIEGATFWPAALQEAVRDRWRFNQMLATLLDFSLIKRVGRERQLSLHRLVQVVQQARMTLEEQGQWVRRVVFAVNALFPRDPANEVVSWPLCERLQEQALACGTLIQQHEILLPQAADLLRRAGIYLVEHALYQQAEPLLQRALSLREQLLGTEHLDTAEILHDLATLYLYEGKYQQAEPLLQRALSLREQLLGTEHLDTVETLNSLEDLYASQGKYKEAEPLAQQVLSLRERHVGPEHPLVARALNNLGFLYDRQGKYNEAEPLLQRSLFIQERHMGSQHPAVALALNNLGFLYNVQGKFTRAEPLFQRALHIYELQLGDGHPSVALALNNLGFLYYQQGKYTQAEPLFQRALHIYELQLGDGHHQGALPLHGLAIVAARQGRHEEAERLEQQALRIIEEQMGTEHPYVVYPLHGLALLFAARGQESSAEALFQQALRIREQHLGAEHLETANLLYDFADFRQAQGQTQTAVNLYQRVLATREHILGSDHPLTSETRTRLETALASPGEKPETAPNR